MEIEDALGEFGLTDLEAKLYLLLLKTGETTAPNLVAKIKIHKATVYDLLAVLERKGLASHIIKDGRKCYSPMEPKCLLNILEGKIDAIREVYPMLEKYYSSTKSEREIRILEGKAGVKALFMDMGKTGKPVLALGSSLQIFPIMEHRIVHPLKNMKISVPSGRIILSSKKEVIESEKKLREFYPQVEVRYYPEKMSAPVAFNTYGDKIALMLWQAEPVVIIIKDPCLAKAFRAYFEIIWASSKK